MGYADGANKAYEQQFQVRPEITVLNQNGFNTGFKEGDAFGKCVGIINASLKWYFRRAVMQDFRPVL